MKLFLVIYGLSCGMMVGAGVVGILILIGIIPRMAQVSKTKEYMSLYEGILVVGTLLGSLISIQKIYINIGWMGAIIFGLAYGIFIGFLSSGLTEVLDYIPTISRRLKVPTMYLKYVIICLLIGKVIGSFVGWTIVRGGL
ncbi:stage V sporulation protein AB [[Clostridium] dakarense]|uniref:stage V sporulation protein AB n=1 Tax=Faecalimicrobium dakarense TaxID=1301100 RepID=UPI0009DFD0B5|nr:stage V sporulation protein AB [[Clostridium] dakarense]